MSGVFGEEVRAEEVADRRPRELLEVARRARRGSLRHVKYVYDWLKPSFASRYMTFGRVNASARKSTSGSRRLDLPDEPLPEGERLRVRVVDAEDAHAVVDPEADDAEQLAPQSARQSSLSKSNG